MKVVSEPTYKINLYMAGDITFAKRFLRKECYPPNKGLCVTVISTTYIYTGGEEEGFIVGFVNYPRFPTTKDLLWDRARGIAIKMLSELGQFSCLLVGDDRTEWLSDRPEDNK